MSFSVYTVEPPSNGHVGTSHFVHCREVVLSLEIKNVPRIHVRCPLNGGYLYCVHYLVCPLSEVPLCTYTYMYPLCVLSEPQCCRPE